MRLISLLIGLGVAALPAAAQSDERKRLYGTWGTDQQCAREPLAPDLTILAEPFEIGPQWLKRGQVWCALNWFPVEQRPDGIFTGAFARCGEDGVRDYVVGMRLTGDSLTLRWDFFSVVNGPLAQCPNS
ncbi:MAG: hypothetical protein AAF677_01300 [Pseudomonadota bacterium]